MSKHCFAAPDRRRPPAAVRAYTAYALAAAAAVALLGATAGVASAHNHVLNPSGACNANGGPGNANELTNPAGRTPGNRDNPRHAADVSQGPANCAGNR